MQTDLYFGLVIVWYLIDCFAHEQQFYVHWKQFLTGHKKTSYRETKYVIENSFVCTEKIINHLFVFSGLYYMRKNQNMDVWDIHMHQLAAG